MISYICEVNFVVACFAVIHLLGLLGVRGWRDGPALIDLLGFLVWRGVLALRALLDWLGLLALHGLLDVLSLLGLRGVPTGFLPACSRVWLVVCLLACLADWLFDGSVSWLLTSSLAPSFAGMLLGCLACLILLALLAWVRRVN